MFSHANKPTIEGGMFSVVQGDAHFHSHPLDTHPRERGLDTLRQHIAPGAFHNSDERYDPPKCHPRTRQAVLGKIMDWIQDPENLRLFLWLYGPAGAGKSAISQTIAEMCQAAGLLVASFFFSRTAVGRNDRAYLISTLSYQLMLSIPEASDQILAVVERDPSIFTRSLEAQIFALIIDPLKSVSLYERNCESMHLRPKLIIIDGLDECGDTKSQKYVLDVLARCSQLPIPLFFLVASRPEHGIRNAFNAEALNSLTISIALDESFHPDDDIRIFLESRFEDIRREHPSGSYLPRDWPSKDAVERLLRKSSGQFIYASTVMKYIESHRHRPTDRLDIILGLSSPGNDTPFAELDALYIQILSSAEEVEKVLTILTFIILDSYLPFERIYVRTLSLVEDILGYTPGDVHVILCDMHAIIHLPALSVQETDRHMAHRLQELRLHHASLGDFLLDRSRSQGFFIDAAKGHADLARCWIKHISTLPPDRIPGLLLDYIMEHCTHAYLTQELMNSLFGFNLQAHIADPLRLGDGPKRVEHFGLWHNFLGWLRKSHDLDPEHTLYRHHLTFLDTWLSLQFARYPDEIRQSLGAALTFSDLFSQTSKAVFEILTHRMESRTARKMRSLDWKIFGLRGYSSAYLNGARLHLIREFLTDPSRARADFVDGDAYSKLAFTMADFLFGSLRQSPLTSQSSLSMYSAKNLSEDSLIPMYDLEGNALRFLPLILPKASKEHELAQLLRDHALQVRSSEVEALHEERLEAASASLQYMKDCGIRIEEHSHIADYTICLVCSDLSRQQVGSDPPKLEAPVDRHPLPRPRFENHLISHNQGDLIPSASLPPKQYKPDSQRKKPLWKRILCLT